MRLNGNSKNVVFIAAALVGMSVFHALADDANSPKPELSTELVSRGRVGLNLAGADIIIAAAKKKATELKVNINIAIVDDGGHLIAFARMDKARPASISTALTKATAAATTRLPTGPLRRGEAEPDLLLNLSLQNAAAANGGKMTGLLGGVPILVDGQVIGAAGVGGATGEQDAEIARTGIGEFLKQLENVPTP